MRFKKQKPLVRNRPGGDQARPKAFSYYGQRQSSEQPPTTRQPGRGETAASKVSLKFIAQRFGAILALSAVLLLLITSVQVTMKPKVDILNEPNALMLRTAADYQNTLERIMKRSWTNTNKLTIDTQSIGRQLMAEYPEVADVSIALPLIGQRPVAYLQLTEPQLLLTNGASQAFVIDENGRALADASRLNASIVRKLPTVTDESGLEIKAGRIAMSADDVSFIKTVLYQLDEAHVEVGRITLPQGSRQLNVYLYKQPYFVKFNLQDGDAKQQVGTFLAVRQRLERQGKQPRQYIDVRLPGRAYYK